jgi:hypothetical protein
VTKKLAAISTEVGKKQCSKGSWLVIVLLVVEVSNLVQWGPVQTMSRSGRQRMKRIQQSERGRAGEVVQATLGYNAGF